VHLAWTAVFDAMFGPPHLRTDPAWGVCAFGFEPNPVHEQKLAELETAYASMGWRSKVFKRTAVGATDGFTFLFRDGDERPGDRFYKEGEHPTSVSASTTRDLGKGGHNVTQVGALSAKRTGDEPMRRQDPVEAVWSSLTLVVIR